MTGSSIQRTPVEVWRMILHHAVASSLLPFIDESHNRLCTGIIQTLDLFTEACMAYQMYRGSEKTIKSLRLVCRMWASILPATSLSRCMITDLRAVCYPGRDILSLKGVERLQLGLNCYCVFNKLEGDDMEDTTECVSGYVSPRGETERDWWGYLEDEATKELIGRVQIFTTYDHNFHKKKILGLMPRLQALSLGFPGRSPPLVAYLSILPQDSCITHLQLYSLPWLEFTAYFAKECHNLPCLRYLHLCFDYRSIWDTNVKHDGEWASLELESLIITGSPGVPMEYMDPFLSRWGKTVRDYVDVSYSLHTQKKAVSAPDGIPPFHHFPHLSIYGTRLETIVTEPDIRHQSQIASVSHSSGRPGTFLLRVLYSEPYCPPEESAFRFIAYVKKWCFLEVVLDRSWTNLRTMWEFDKPSKPLSEAARWHQIFFRTLLKEGLNVLDRYSIPISDGRYRKIWEQDIKLYNSEQVDVLDAQFGGVSVV
ncbi:hypothetical protein CPB86DRAFT_783529 [Serendipita vermifera]|nr:hypothetical protein CPB86DRAFT_783529 [Serendipita vermifera]